LNIFNWISIEINYDKIYWIMIEIESLMALKWYILEYVWNYWILTGLNWPVLNVFELELSISWLDYNLN